MAHDLLELASVPGAVGRIGDVSSLGDGVARRLRELGFCRGTEVRFLRRAPLGDPLLFELRGSQFCLRRAEAARVLLEDEGAEPS